jgi:hypothetical protein
LARDSEFFRKIVLDIADGCYFLFHTRIIRRIIKKVKGF